MIPPILVTLAKLAGGKPQRSTASWSWSVVSGRQRRRVAAALCSPNPYEVSAAS